MNFMFEAVGRGWPKDWTALARYYRRCLRDVDQIAVNCGPEWHFTCLQPVARNYACQRYRSATV